MSEWPSSFLDLKRELVSATTQERLTASWNDLLGELTTRTAEIAQAGPNVSWGLRGSAMTVDCYPSTVHPSSQLCRLGEVDPGRDRRDQTQRLSRHSRCC